MKQIQYLCFIALLAVSFCSSAQSPDKKSNISIGGGTERYRGDLGNAWFKPHEEVYGLVCFSYGQYLTPSFDVNTGITFGDYGHCKDEDVSKYRADGTEVLNMLCRLTSLSLTAKYKFANGYLLHENARIAPYIYLGAAINNVTDYWWANKERVNAGNYGSLNGGAGVRYNFCSKFTLTYNLGFGYFTSDNIDYRSVGTNDMYMQNILVIGMNF